MDRMIFNSSAIGKFDKLKTELIKCLTTLQEDNAHKFLTYKKNHI